MAGDYLYRYHARRASRKPREVGGGGGGGGGWVSGENPGPGTHQSVTTTLLPSSKGAHGMDIVHLYTHSVFNFEAFERGPATRPLRGPRTSNFDEILTWGYVQGPNRLEPSSL